MTDADARSRFDRVIFHLDMDAFFAAVEVREDPTLKGLPLIIGRKGPRGVVATCSYEARAFGVRSAMPAVRAERLCPQAVWRGARHGVYSEISHRIGEILDRYSPIVEWVSIDEAFLDMTGIARDLAHGARIARAVKADIVGKEKLTGSIGISYNRFLSKIGSDMEKPDGLVVLGPADVPVRIHPLPVQKLWGVGPRTAERLNRVNVRLIGDLLRCPEKVLVDCVGRGSAGHLLALARGEDPHPIHPGRERKSMSEETTYLEDLTDRETIEQEILRKAEGVAYGLRSRKLKGRTVDLKIRTGDFTTCTRSRTLSRPTDLGDDIYRAALELLRERVDLQGKGIRLIGVGMSGLIDEDQPAQLEMFTEVTREQRLAAAADAVRGRFGEKAITRARLVKKPRTDDGVTEDDEE